MEGTRQHRQGPAVEYLVGEPSGRDFDGVPTIGTFENGRGKFSSFQQIKDRWVVRFIHSGITTNSMHGEAYPSDGGKTWAPTWIEDLTREE